jgi:DNA-binding HxlR family transcriptional regulator
MRKILQDLVFIGATEDTVKAFGRDWKLKTLTSEEHLEATNATGDFDTLTRIYALKMEILSRSLKGINDVELIDKNEAREVIKQLQPPIVNKLYEEYEKLQKKQNDSLSDLEEIKN